MQKFGTAPHTAKINQAGKPTVKYKSARFSFSFSFFITQCPLKADSLELGIRDSILGFKIDIRKTSIKTYWQ